MNCASSGESPESAALRRTASMTAGSRPARDAASSRRAHSYARLISRAATSASNAVTRGPRRVSFHRYSSMRPSAAAVSGLGSAISRVVRGDGLGCGAVCPHAVPREASSARKMMARIRSRSLRPHRLRERKPLLQRAAVGLPFEAEHLELAGVARREALADFDRRGLAGAVRAEQPETFAGLNLEIDAVDGDDVLEGFAKIADAQDRFGHGREGFRRSRLRGCACFGVRRKS